MLYSGPARRPQLFDPQTPELEAAMVPVEQAANDLANARDRVIAAAKEAIRDDPEPMWELWNAVAALHYYEDRHAKAIDHFCLTK